MVMMDTDLNLRNMGGGGGGGGQGAFGAFRVLSVRASFLQYGFNFRADLFQTLS